MKKETERNTYAEENIDHGKLKKKILSQNLSVSSFYISKAEIEISSEDGNQKFIASIKFLKPDKFLISLKSKTGIEAVRIYLDSDTILANDRINRNLYRGRADFVNNKYRIPVRLLPAIFGDLILSDTSGVLNECNNGFSDYQFVSYGVKYSYIIDCNRGKVFKLRKVDDIPGESIGITYTKFVEINSKSVPSLIRIDFADYSIKIKIDKLEIPWEGNLEFIPGSKYELIDLR